MTIDIGVVTRVPDPETEYGNLSVALVYGVDEPTKISVITSGALVQVFDLGEILIIDDSGRDSRGRKHHKWDVGVEYFETLEQAVARSQEVRNW